MLLSGFLETNVLPAGLALICGDCGDSRDQEQGMPIADRYSLSVHRVCWMAVPCSCRACELKVRFERGSYVS